MTPSFQGEVQFRRYSDTSTQGQQVVFALQDRDDLQRFIGKEGKRFMAVLVELTDDEQPVAGNPESETKGRGKLGDLCWRAVQWCDDPEFQRWVKARTECQVDITAEMAKDYVLAKCGVDTRKKLDTEPEASERFNCLIRGPYQKHLQARGMA